ncbi:hypothetical protein AAFF_G00284240 [Aldrovandia affinis]|uniref:Uncharacterized protein n=1 Tax=Aldrovandia affinis TaxID=143900 RepID=A0AAD7TA57_9TELE|nr:hypothetical protein AAFF_G00284240 [Aldrovandia affinis]
MRTPLSLAAANTLSDRSSRLVREPGRCGPARCLFGRAKGPSRRGPMRGGGGTVVQESHWETDRSAAPGKGHAGAARAGSAHSGFQGKKERDALRTNEHFSP